MLRGSLYAGGSPLSSLDSSNSLSWRILLRVVERGLYPAGRRARARRGAIDWQARLPSFLPTNQSARSPGSEAAPLHHNKVRPRTDRPLVAELRPKHPAPFSQHFLPTTIMSRAHSVLPSRGIVPKTQAKHFWVAFSHHEIGYPLDVRTAAVRKAE